ncbi:37 kDa salivary gland allergen Aed a 2-like [Culex pipiens pallens]|uniref:37 kDa salivary gland allergen Aed a 2-like n=1 Tax=Culex pipiens pallens TaxID=42434 RepID=UPI0019539305|nr:37 kDa salivary gland allergen Aed a 2-like [Culex pipiens pallens]
MMKIAVTLLCCLVAVTKANFTVKQMQKIHASFVNCSNNLAVPEDTVHYEEHSISGDLALNDPLFKRDLLCVMRGMRIVNETGDIDLPRMKEFLRDGHDEKTLEEMLKICTKTEEGAAPEDKIYQFYRCFWTQNKFVV